MAFNTFVARLIQAVHMESPGSHVSLHGHNSGAECARELFKHAKDLASLRVRNETKFSVVGFKFFVSDIISAVLLGLFGHLHLILGPNHWMEVFCSIVCWNLG